MIPDLWWSLLSSAYSLAPGNKSFCSMLVCPVACCSTTCLTFKLPALQSSSYFSLINVQFFVWHWVFIWSFVPVWPIVYIIVIITCRWLFSNCVKMLSSGSVLVCLCSWSQRFCSADICVGLMCCLLHVTILPVFMMWMWYKLPWWFWSPFPSIMPWVKVPHLPV